MGYLCEFIASCGCKSLSQAQTMQGNSNTSNLSRKFFQSVLLHSFKRYCLGHLHGSVQAAYLAYCYGLLNEPCI